jgi:hypothetical protein
MLGLIDSFLRTVDRSGQELAGNTPSRVEVVLDGFHASGSEEIRQLTADPNVVEAEPPIAIPAQLSVGAANFGIGLQLAPRVRSGKRRSGSTACASRRRAGCRAPIVQGRWTGAGRYPHDVRLGCPRPRGRGLRHGADLREAARAVRPTAVQLPDRAGSPGEDARRGHRHAALLHAARAARGGRAALGHDRGPRASFDAAVSSLVLCTVRPAFA